MEILTHVSECRGPTLDSSPGLGVAHFNPGTWEVEGLGQDRPQLRRPAWAT